MIEHRVYFKLKSGTDAEQLQDLYSSILGLKDSIYGIISVDFKKNLSKERKDHGYKDFFVMIFKNARFLEDYLGNPVHREVALQHFRPYVDDVFVSDNEI